MVFKIIRYYQELSISDFIRKIIDFFFQKYYKIKSLSRCLKSYTYFRRWDVKIGEGVLNKGQSSLIKIGDNFEIYDYCVIELGHKAKFVIGQNCLISYGVVLQCREKVKFGDFVQVGEYTSIRDTTHHYGRKEIPVKFQPDISRGVEIGNDVWIGRGCIILPGTKIGNGVIIGANSVVKGEFEDYGIYAGCPAKLIKKR